MRQAQHNVFSNKVSFRSLKLANRINFFVFLCFLVLELEPRMEQTDGRTDGQTDRQDRQCGLLGPPRNILAHRQRLRGLKTSRAGSCYFPTDRQLEISRRDVCAHNFNICSQIAAKWRFSVLNFVFWTKIVREKKLSDRLKVKGHLPFPPFPLPIQMVLNVTSTTVVCVVYEQLSGRLWPIGVYIVVATLCLRPVTDVIFPPTLFICMRYTHAVTPL